MALGSAYCGTIRKKLSLKIDHRWFDEAGRRRRTKSILDAGRRACCWWGEGPPKRAHSQPSEEEEKRLGKTTRWGLLGSAVGRPVLEGLGSRKHWWIQTGAGQHPAPAASSNAGMTRATCVVLCCTSVLFLPFFQRHLSLPFSSDTRGPASPCSLGASQAVSFRRERSCPSLPPVTLARAGCVADLRSLCPCRP